MFILYKLVPLETGGTDKVPVNPATGENSNAQDTSTWMLPSVAAGWAAYYGAGFGVGIVIYEGSGLFCLDLDSAKETGVLSETDKKLVREFAGCYIEYSQSGKSLHIIGSYTGDPPTHSTKNKAEHIELYTKLRFIALTGNLYA